MVEGLLMIVFYGIIDLLRLIQLRTGLMRLIMLTLGLEHTQVKKGRL